MAAPRRLVILTMGGGGGGEGMEENWLGAPMYWSNWDRSTNIRLVIGAGFEIVRADDEIVEEDGRPVPFLWLIARRPS